MTSTHGLSTLPRRAILVLLAGLLCAGATAQAQITVDLQVIGSLHLGAGIEEFANLKPLPSDGAIKLYRWVGEQSLGNLMVDSLELGFHEGILVSGAFICARLEDGETLLYELSRLHGTPAASSDRASVWMSDEAVLAAEHSDSICRGGFTNRPTIEALRESAADEQRSLVEASAEDLG